MGYKIWKREEFRRSETKRFHWFWGMHHFDDWKDLAEPHLHWRNRRRKVQPCEKWEAEDFDRYYRGLGIKYGINGSVHGRICTFSSRFYHPLWRRWAKHICQFHIQGLHDEADNLDPQIKKLGIMRYI